MAPALAAGGYRVLAPDLRGYSPGARPAARSAYRNSQLAADVLALADAAGAERFHLAGHDWGAALAWYLAGRHPGRVTSLAALSVPHPQAFARALITGSQAARSWYMAACQLPWLPERVLGRRGGQAFRDILVRTGLDPASAEPLRRPGPGPGCAARSAQLVPGHAVQPARAGRADPGADDVRLG